MESTDNGHHSDQPVNPPSPAWLPPLRFAAPMAAAKTQPEPPELEQPEPENQLSQEEEIPPMTEAEIIELDEIIKREEAATVTVEIEDWASRGLDGPPDDESNASFNEENEEGGDDILYGNEDSEDEEEQDLDEASEIEESDHYEDNDWEAESEAQPSASELLEVLQLGFDEIKEMLNVGNTESRRTSKRVMEILRQFGQILDAVSGTVRNLHESSRQAQIEAKTSTALSNGDSAKVSAPAFIEFFDRLKRIRDAADAPPPVPKKSWFGDSAVRRALAPWKEERLRLRQSLVLLEEHATQLLRNSGCEPVPTKGSIFDPSCMIAVETVTDGSLPDHSVESEILAGWREASTGKILRAAQVRVARKQSINPNL